MTDAFKPVIEDGFDRAARLIKEARNSAPLDPSKVKAGDTVTLESGTALVRDVVSAVTKFDDGSGYQFLSSEPPTSYRRVGPTAWTLTDHQPAPEPEPEWKPGTFATVTTERRGEFCAIRRETGVTPPVVWQSIPDGSWWEDSDVSHVRPLVVIDPAAVDVDSVSRVIHQHMQKVRDRGDYMVGPAADEAARETLGVLGIEAP